MAKLGAYYGLCPIIDHRSLLGITPDNESGNVIVTLGKNIAIKYRLLDQKQVNSWRTKEKFTSPIIFERNQKEYSAVFNQSYLRNWKGDEEFLDKVKKIKFQEKIYTIFECNNKCFILFANGAISPLQQAVENRKTLKLADVIDPETQHIFDVVYAHHNNDIYVGLIVKKGETQSLFWTKFNENLVEQKFYTIPLNRKDLELAGWMIHVDKNSINFFSLWSDGGLFSNPLQPSDLEADNSELLTVIETISCKDYVSMVPLDENYIALYGCNTNEEGALLLIYNVQFKVTQSKQPFKLFTQGAKLWAIDTNLFLTVGQNLAVVPFILHTEQLAALVGSHKVLEVEQDSDISIVHKIEQVKWSKQSKNEDEKIIPGKIKPIISELVEQGLPETLILAQILPDIVEKQNISLLTECLKFFTDISEEWLAKLLKFTLNADEKLFKSANNKVVAEGYEEFPIELKSSVRIELLNLLLCKSFNDSLLLPYLHKEISVSDAVILLKYISFHFSDSSNNQEEIKLPNFDFIQSETKLIEWGTILIDSNYQKFILARDEKINQVLKKFNNIVGSQLNCLHELNKVLPLIVEMNKRKSVSSKIVANDLHYSIEELTLY